MKAIKLVVLVAGAIGLLSFFLPLFEVDVGGPSKETVSGFQLVKGLHAVQSEVEHLGDTATGADAAETRLAARGAKSDLGALKGVVLAIWAPALLITLIGGIGVGRKKFGRVAGTFTMLLGLVELGVAAIGLSDGARGVGIAIYLMLVTGIVAFVSGVIALIKPDRGAQLGTVAAMPRKAA
jgi:hypothetical protein